MGRVEREGGEGDGGWYLIDGEGKEAFASSISKDISDEREER